MDKAEIDEILSPEDAAKMQANEANVRNGFWIKLRKTAGRIPFVDTLVAAYYCAMDPETPARARVILFAALAYFILPLDSIPDFLLGFGLTDDIAVITTAISIARQHITDAHRLAARRFLEQEQQDA